MMVVGGHWLTDTCIDSIGQPKPAMRENGTEITGSFYSPEGAPMSALGCQTVSLVRHNQQALVSLSSQTLATL